MDDEGAVTRIEGRLERIETKLDRLLELRERTTRRVEERDTDLIGTDYVAALFGCSQKSVRAGKAGTKLVPWIRDGHGRRVRPLKATRRGALEAYRVFVRGEATKKKPKRGLVGSSRRARQGEA